MYDLSMTHRWLSCDLCVWLTYEPPEWNCQSLKFTDVTSCSPSSERGVARNL